MQRQRNIFDIFPENMDLNQGPSYNGLDDECNSRISPNERRLLSNEISGEKSYSSWDVGESSSRPNAQNHAANNNNNNNRSTSLGTHDSRVRERQFDLSRAGSSLNLQNAGSDDIPVDVDLNLEYRDDGGPVRGISLGNNQSQSSAIVNSREPTVRESAVRYINREPNSYSQRSTQQPPSMPVPGMPRNLLPFPFIGTGNSRNGSSSSSGVNQDNSSLVTGRSNINGVNGQYRTIMNDGNILPNLNATTDDQQISNDIPPWSPFPYLETESGGHRGHFRNFPSGPSDENVLLSGSRNQPRDRQPNLRLEVFDDEWQAFGGDLEGRHRLVSEVRQILSVLRRGQNFNAEDYLLVDPVINGVADLHDRHRDMRLDVDNMSYEELLALGESIGDVKTGLTEDVVMKSMKQRKHLSFMAITTQNFEPCCICQEEYNNGEDVGILECGHEFHTCCIKQWLTQKNLCPICKLPGLST
ncbi:putative transcription factor C2H2 family [Helianthus annuus]|nr:putative transcription factor C2H2 family [Helianthus annuus]